MCSSRLGRLSCNIDIIYYGANSIILYKLYGAIAFMCYFLCSDMSQCEVTINLSFKQKNIRDIKHVEKIEQQKFLAKKLKWLGLGKGDKKRFNVR